MAELLKPGVVVGETWVVEELIGRGGMGEVWRARHRRVEDKQAAIKVLRASAELTEDVLARFRREADIAARLEHPNIVHLFDFATLPTGEPYIVMEFLRGESLKARLARGPVPFDELAPLVVQLCSALHVAHARGVVHRDLKPDNIFLVPTPTGDQVKVLDFGISKLIDSNTLDTSNSVLIGTPAYMSPEQALAENSALTPRSDVFTVATICYEALSGRSPFRADGLVRTVHRIVHDEPPLLDGVDAPVAQALRRAMAKTPEARTPDIATFAAEFTGVQLSGVTSRPGVGASATPAPRRAPGGATDRDAATLDRAAAQAPVPDATKNERPPPTATRRGPRLAVAVGVGAVLAVALLAWRTTRGAEAPPPAPPVEVTPALPAEDAKPAADERAPRRPLPPEDAVPPEPEPAVDAGKPAPVATRPERPAPPPVEPPLDETGRALLQTAEEAFSAERYGDALGTTQKPSLARSGRAAALRAMSACAVGNLGLLNATWPQLPAQERAAARKFCRSRGVEVP